MALADALGNLVDLPLLLGKAHDLRGTADLIEGLPCGQLLAESSSDADWLHEALDLMRGRMDLEPPIVPPSVMAALDRHWQTVVQAHTTLPLTAAGQN